jgi:16S rRNA (guanine966-N2)-methyltransferase
MTRIIAGRFGGRTLTVPARGTRPTSDRVREAIFSRLSHDDILDGARVLDLYAGSGALGLEALSRGASHVTLVDSGRQAVEAARRNVSALTASSAVVVTAEDVTRYAARLAETTSNPSLDLVFIDPPYDVSNETLEAVLESLASPTVLSEHAIVVVERSTRTPAPTWPEALELFSTKAYGETIVYYLEPSDLSTERSASVEVL